MHASLKPNDVIYATEDIRSGNLLLASKGDILVIHWGLGGIADPVEVNNINNPLLSFTVTDDQWSFEKP